MPFLPDQNNKDPGQTLKESFDPALNRLRVDALINDGTDALVINPDGSINVNIVTSVVGTSTYRSSYSEVTSVASSVLTTIQTYIVPLATNAFLQKIDVSGTNIATYQLEINAVVQDKKRTYFSGPFNETFSLHADGEEGFPLSAGATVVIKVIHARPDVGDFNARIQVVEIP